VGEDTVKKKKKVEGVRKDNRGRGGGQTNIKTGAPRRARI